MVGSKKMRNNSLIPKMCNVSDKCTVKKLFPKIGLNAYFQSQCKITHFWNSSWYDCKI